MVSKNFKVWDQDNSVPKVEKKLTVSIRKDRVVFPVETRNALKIGVGQDVTSCRIRMIPWCCSWCVAVRTP